MPEGLIPVFVFPNCLKFNLSDQSTHKQVLTLYNPYDFPVRFQGRFQFKFCHVNLFIYQKKKILFVVLCSSRDRHKYTVVDPEGKIQTHCCVDIVIRHNSLSNQNVGEIDKFRIQMYQFATNKV